MSGSHAYGGDCPGMLGAYHYGGGGLGVLGSLLATGGYIYPSLNPAADLAKEYYGLITSIPAGLTIDTGEAGDFDASANDGTYATPWDLYEDGSYLGSTTLTTTFGTGSAINLSIANLTTAATLSAVSGSVIPASGGAPATLNLVVSNLRTAASLSTLTVGVVPVGSAPYVSPSCTVVLEGLASRVTL